jgi:hypothetical protein
MKRTPLARRSKRKIKTWVEYDALMAEYPGQRCAICDSLGRPDIGKVCGHHILSKGAYPQYRLEPKNIIPLCQAHHTWSSLIAPHSIRHAAVIAWWCWLQEHSPVQWRWMLRVTGRDPLQNRKESL